MPSDFEDLNTYKSICPKLSCKGAGQNSVRKTESSPWKTVSISNSIYSYTVCGRNEPISSSNPPSEAQSRDGFNVTGRYSGNSRCQRGFPIKKIPFRPQIPPLKVKHGLASMCDRTIFRYFLMLLRLSDRNNYHSFSTLVGQPKNIKKSY